MNKIKTSLKYWLAEIKANQQLQLSIIAVVVTAIITVSKVQEQAEHRKTPTSKSKVELEIQALKGDLSILQSQRELKSPEYYWSHIESIAAFYKVRLSGMSDKAADSLYQGNLKPWHGKLEGHKSDVLAALLDIQKHTPTRLYHVHIGLDVMKVDISVLGASDE